jgi:hypothetical protein
MALSPTSSRGSSSGGSITVTDGTHSVNPATTLDFTAGVTVTDAGGGQANAAVTGAAVTFTPTATKTANYTAAANEFVAGDSTGGSFTVTLPQAPANGTVVAVQNIGSANTITVAANTGDTIATTTNTSLGTTRRSAMYQYRASDKVWFALSPATNPVLSFTADGTTIVNGGTSTAPNVHTGTLDVIAANQAPAADWSNNSHKIQGVTAGAATGEVAIYDQTPAGIVTTKGDILAASAAHVAARVGVGSDGQVLTADAASAAGVKWATAAGGGGQGDLLQAKSGNYTQLLASANSTGAVGTVNQARTFPFAFAGAVTLTEVRVNVTTAIASSVIRIGIYSSDSFGLPGTLLADFGTVDSSTTGEKTIASLSQALAAGTGYHLCIVTQGGASAPSCSVSNRPVAGGPSTTTNYTDPRWGAFSTTTISGALPGTFPWSDTLGPGSPFPTLVLVKVS